MTALLSLQAARIDAGGAVLFDGISFESHAAHLGLVGNWEPLFALAAGRARLTAGTLTIRGTNPRLGVRDGRIGLALSDVVFLESSTALAYLEQSAELCGLSSRAARSAAKAALGAVGLAHLGTRRFSTLTVAERRAVVIAHATLSNPEVLLLEAPLDGLDTHAERLVAEVIDRAAGERSLLVSVRSIAPLGAQRALLERLGDVALIEAGSLVASGKLDQALPTRSRYAVTVLRHGPELAARLGELGLQVTLGAQRTDGARLFVELGDARSTNDVLDAALHADAPIVELVPT